MPVVSLSVSDLQRRDPVSQKEIASVNHTAREDPDRPIDVDPARDTGAGPPPIQEVAKHGGWSASGSGGAAAATKKSGKRKHGGDDQATAKPDVQSTTGSGGGATKMRAKGKIQGHTPPLRAASREDFVRFLLRLGVGLPLCKLHKELYKSDATADQGRLQFTGEQARDFLHCKAVTRAEMDTINAAGKEKEKKAGKEKGKDKGTDKGLSLDVYDRAGNKYEMAFGKVNSIPGKDGVYRLKGFGRYVQDWKLVAGQHVVIWVFRQPPSSEEEEGKLVMVLMKYGSTNHEALEEALDKQMMEDYSVILGLRKLLKASD